MTSDMVLAFLLTVLAGLSTGIGSAKQTCDSSNEWGAKTCVPVPGSDAGTGVASGGGKGAGAAFAARRAVRLQLH